MKLPLHLFFVQFLFMFYYCQSAQLQKTAKTTQDLRYEKGEPNHQSSSLALSSVFYNWANLYQNPSEIGQIIQQLNITDDCKAHTMEFLFRLTSQEYVKQSPWAMQSKIYFSYSHRVESKNKMQAYVCSDRFMGQVPRGDP